jgi:hypothetical protein
MIFLFSPKLKLILKAYHFQTLDSVQKAIKILKEVDFQSCYDVWKICWTKNVAAEGCYFEGAMLI